MFRMRQHLIIVPFLVVIIAIFSVVSSLPVNGDNGKFHANVQGVAYTRSRSFADEVQPMLSRKKRQLNSSDPEIDQLIGQLLPCFSSKPVDFSKCFDQFSPGAMAKIRKLADFAESGTKQLAKMVKRELEQLKALARVVTTISQAVMRIKGVKNKTPEQLESEQIKKTPTGKGGGEHGNINDDSHGINNRNEDGEQVSYQSGRVQIRGRRRFGVGSSKQIRRRWAIEKY